MYVRPAVTSAPLARGEQLRREIDERGFAFCAVEGTSMSPTLRAGDIVRVVRPAAVKRNDIVVVLAPNGTAVTHRLVRVSAGSVTCRGDNRVANDAPVRWAEVAGRVAEVFAPGRTDSRSASLALIRLRRSLRLSAMFVRRARQAVLARLRR